MHFFWLTTYCSVLLLTMTVVHFIGVTDTQLVSAQKTWGRADFVHRWHDWRSHGDIDWDNDIVVFGNKAKNQPNQYSWQDHELY